MYYNSDLKIEIILVVFNAVVFLRQPFLSLPMARTCECSCQKIKRSAADCHRRLGSVILGEIESSIEVLVVSFVARIVEDDQG